MSLDAYLGDKSMKYSKRVITVGIGIVITLGVEWGLRLGQSMWRSFWGGGQSSISWSGWW